MPRMVLSLALLLLPASLLRAQDLDFADPIRFDVHVTQAGAFDPSSVSPNGSKVKVRRGEVARVYITGTPRAGLHTYPVSKRADGQSLLSSITVPKVKGVAPLWPVLETDPIPVKNELGKTNLHHETKFTWALDFAVLPDATPGSVHVPIRVSTMACNDGSGEKQNCFPVQPKLDAAFEISAEPAVGLSAEVQKRLGATRPEPEIVQVSAIVPPLKTPESPPAPVAPSAETKAETKPGTKDKQAGSVYGLITDSHEEYQKKMEAIAEQLDNPSGAVTAQGGSDLGSFVLAGIFWGAVSLITPCVFPMIPITVSFFLKQSEKEHHRPVVMAAVYSLTIVVVLTLAAAFLLSVFRWLSVHPLTNYFLGGLFVFFALSLFGMYEIELPSGLARFTSAHEGKGGLVGTIFMALTFTIISFACVAPFLGGFGGTAAAARPLWHNLLGGLAFSATFAAPFFLLALFPSLLRALPKSGAWLNSVKVVMGFLELAAAFKFFRGAELVQTAGEPAIFTYDLVLGLWIALCLLAALYLIGTYRLPHDSPVESIGVPRLLFAMAFLCLAFYLVPALFKLDRNGQAQRPTGEVYAWVDSFLLPEAFAQDKHVTGNLPYAVAEAREYLKRTGKPKRIFVDFTGVTCSNCRLNERNVFSRPAIQGLLDPYLEVQVYTDTVPAHFYGPGTAPESVDPDDGRTRSKQDAEDVNVPLLAKKFELQQLPVYVVLEPRPDGRIQVVGMYDEGKINNVGAFSEFLRHPEQWAGKKPTSE